MMKIILIFVFISIAPKISLAYSHFISYHIDSSDVRNRVAEIQAGLLQKDPLFEKYFEKLTSLHVSVDYLELNETSIEIAKTALSEAGKKLSTSSVSLRGFGSLVGFLYVNAFSDDDQPLALIKNKESVKNTFATFGIQTSWWWPYVAHMTLANVNGPDQPRLEFKWFTLLFDARKMGSFEIKSIRLCAWDIPEGDDDYPVLAEAFFPQ
uniref:A-kinase anchor protein 7-like phosphoesterase domain-containing protein n=1 Tax=Panagrolaimus superbus TaxID=310955 RepID=A0A914YZN6_9BILA